MKFTYTYNNLCHSSYISKKHIETRTRIIKFMIAVSSEEKCEQEMFIGDLNLLVIIYYLND